MAGSELGGIMKHWLLSKGLLMGVSNWLANTIAIIWTALTWMLRGGVGSIYSINLTSSYFSISFIVNFRDLLTTRAFTTHIYDEMLMPALRPDSEAANRKKLIGIEIVSVFLILEYSYSNFGHLYTT